MSDLRERMQGLERDLQDLEQQIASSNDDELRTRRHQLKNDIMDLRIRLYLETGE